MYQAHLGAGLHLGFCHLHGSFDDAGALLPRQLIPADRPGARGSRGAPLCRARVFWSSEAAGRAKCRINEASRPADHEGGAYCCQQHSRAYGRHSMATRRSPVLRINLRVCGAAKNTFHDTHRDLTQHQSSPPRRCSSEGVLCVGPHGGSVLSRFPCRWQDGCRVNFRM